MVDKIIVGVTTLLIYEVEDENIWERVICCSTNSQMFNLLQTKLTFEFIYTYSKEERMWTSFAWDSYQNFHLQLLAKNIIIVVTQL